MRPPSVPASIVLLLFLYSAFSADLFAQTDPSVWRLLPVPPSSGQAYSFIDFADSLHGWVMSPDRRYSVTSDGGQTWCGPITVADTGTVRSMKWLGGDSAIVAIQVGPWWSLGPSILLRTTDRGQSWLPASLPTGRRFRSTVSLINRSLIGYVSVGDSLYDPWLCTSTDLGESWRVDSLPSRILQRTGDFGILSADRMIFCSFLAGTEGSGMILRSADFGKTCTSMVSRSALSSSRGRFMNAELSYFSYGWGDEIPWSAAFAYNAFLDRTASIPASSMGALFRDGSVFALPQRAAITARSADPSDSTFTIGPYEPSPDRLADLCMISPACGWVLDGHGRVFRRVDLLTAVGEQPEGLPERFELLQNYPNPFNPRTTVRYVLPAAGEVDLRVTDVLGREVFRFVEHRTAGVKNVAVDLSGRASGVYVCSIRFNGTARGVKMALVR